MNCKKCGFSLPSETKFCPSCGATCSENTEQPRVSTPQPEAAPVTPPPAYTPPVYSGYVPPVQPAPVASERDLPEKYRPLGAWTYFALSLLYSIPVVGFIFLIIFSCKDDNINRRNYTRSYWCSLIIFGGLLLLTISVIAAIDIDLLEDIFDTIFDF